MTIEQLKELPALSAGIKDAQKVYEIVDLNSTQIEELLKQSEYTAEIPDYSWITKKERRAVNAVESVTSFGCSMGDLFEDLIIEYGRIPSQQEYLKHSLDKMKAFWENPKNKLKTKDFEWAGTVERACKNRSLRTYTSQLVEIHCITSLRELFPEWHIYFSDALDLLLGVDLVVETEKKRIYCHIFKNSSSGFKAFYKKEKRGGAKGKDGKFVKFNRDFSGDKSLMFDHQTNVTSETTQFINGHPLFKKEWLDAQFLIFDKFKQIGVPLSDDSKIKYLNDYMEKVGWSN